MNKERREALLEVADILDEAINQIEEIKFEEEESFDALPEGLQMSSRGDSMQEAIDIMDGFMDSIAAINKDITEYAKQKKKKK